MNSIGIECIEFLGISSKQGAIAGGRKGPNGNYTLPLKILRLAQNEIQLLPEAIDGEDGQGAFTYLQKLQILDLSSNKLALP